MSIAKLALESSGIFELNTRNPLRSFSLSLISFEKEKSIKYHARINLLIEEVT